MAGKLLAPSKSRMLNPGNWGGAPPQPRPGAEMTRRASSSSLNSSTSVGSSKPQPPQLRNTLSNTYQQQQPQRFGPQPAQQQRTIQITQNPKPSGAPAAKGRVSTIGAHKPSTVVPSAPAASKAPAAAAPGAPAPEVQGAELDHQVKALSTEKAALQEELSAERLRGFERDEEVPPLKAPTRIPSSVAGDFVSPSW